MNAQSEKLGDDEALLEQGRRIRALHEIISRPDLTFDEQIDEALLLGCRLLNTEVGKLGRQEPENNKSHFLNTVVTSDLQVKRGMIFPLDKTFCNVTFSSPEAIAISHVAESEYRDHPAARFLGIQSYIGTAIYVHGKKYGTVNFTNRAPVPHPFTEADKDLVKLIGSWISVMMERELDAKELKRLKENAEAANLAKTVFLANLSHEMRTPLTAIIGFSDIALDPDESAEGRGEALKTIRSSSDHLLNLINDILDFSKIEAGALDLEHASASPMELLDDVVSIVHHHAQRKKLAFGVEHLYPLPEKIDTDPLRLKQILLNLCNNAIKFTATGTVAVRVSFDTEQNRLCYRVTDTGIGMSPDQLQQIFEPFKQGDASTSRRFGGTGLGLSLSNRLAELLNGQLTVRSEVGKGSEFELSLDLKPNAETALELVYEPRSSRPGPEAAKPWQSDQDPTGTALVAEDNNMIQLLMTKYLEKIGVAVTTADNGAAALELAQQQRFDIIFMDMQMPEMSGIDAVRALRASDYTAPIVMLTANATLDHRDLCKEAGCDEFLIKPIDRKKLYEVTRSYLQPADTEA